MPNNLDPRIDQWYAHLDKGQRFYVTTFDREDETIEVQHFDGDLEELTLEEWRQLEIELSEAPENWSGALDIVEQDDFGTDITDTQPEDWREPGQDFLPAGREKLAQELEASDEGSSVDFTTGQPTRRASVESTVSDTLVKRADGKYEESLSDIWVAEYSEDPDTGLWKVEVFKHEVSEWRALGYSSMEEARRSAEEYYNQV